MEFFNRIITHYGWEGTALAGVLLVMFGIQLYYYLFVYGRIPKYKDTRRPEILSETPPVSVVIPLFSEDYAFVEEILPLIVAQEYPDFEVVIVYVGRDTDFYDDLVRIKQSFPQITATKIELNPRFPISPKMALNVGIKSAHYEHLLFTTPDVYPTSDRWLSLMANGFRRGENRARLLRHGARERVCELPDPHLADDALGGLDLKRRMRQTLPGHAPELRIHQAALFRRQRLQPPQYEYRRRRFVHVADHRPRQCQRGPLSPRHPA